MYQVTAHCILWYSLLKKESHYWASIFLRSGEKKIAPLVLTCEEEEEEHHDDGVAEVEEGGQDALNLQLGHVVVDTVDEEVDGGEAASEERPPPPVVVLQSKLCSVWAAYNRRGDFAC